MQRPRTGVAFYIGDHQKQDAEIHDSILADGDDAAALVVSTAVAKRLGLTNHEIAALVAAPTERKAKRYFDETEHPRDPDGKFASKGGSEVGAGDATPAQVFVSPNVSNLDFDHAVDAVDSERQDQLSEIAGYIDDKLGLKSSVRADVIGAWTDGAENSVMVSTPGATVPEVRVSGAMMGHLADQKAVLVFEPAASGPHFMAEFPVKGSLHDIHNQLLNLGLANHTLEPSADGARVHVFGMDQATLDTVTTAGKHYDSRPQITFGHGEFVGTQLDTGSDREQRDDARRVYEEVIGQADAAGLLPGRDIAKAWNDVRARWAALSGDPKDEVDTKQN